MSNPERAQGGVPVAHPPRITDPEKPIRVLHKGFDGLDVSFTGALRSEDLEILERGRAIAEKELREPLVEIGPGKVPMFVASSGAKGGYRFRCDTGPIGATIFFKKSLNPHDWNIRVSMKSAPLAYWGILQVWKELLELVENLGVRTFEHRISRVDFAIDYLMSPDFSLNANQFVAHSRTTNWEVSSVPRFLDQQQREVQIHFSGRVPSSVTLGKMPGRQVIIYNKRKEVIQKQKYYWFDIWGLDSEDDNASVWRIEVRAGKRRLDLFRIKTFEDLENQFGDIVEEALRTIRYIRPVSDTANVSRHPLHPLWAAVGRDTAVELFDFRSGIVPQAKVIEGLRERIRDNYNAQMISLLPGALIANGFTVGNAVENIGPYFAIVEKLVKNQKARFLEKLILAKERLHFTQTRN